MWNRLKPVLPVLVLGVAFAAAYADVVARLVRNWANDGNYSHGFLIAPVAVYLIWTRRARLAALPAAPSLAGLAVLLASLAMLVVGIFAAEVFLARISMLGAIAGAVLFVYGRGRLRLVAFPLALLFLAIPLPAIVFNQVALPLQMLASRLGVTALSLAGTPAYREGNIIALAHGSLEVADACSGIRSLMSLVALAAVYGCFAGGRAWMRALLVLAAIPIAVVVNGLRVGGTGLLWERFGPAAAQGFFHAFSGWLMFLAAFLALVGVHGALALASKTRRPRAAGAVQLKPDPTAS